jgi:hypothetical protein
VAQEQVKPTYDTSGVLTKLEADSDHDGKIDTWAYMDGPRVVRVEVDENGDGTIDRWEYHTNTGRDGQDAKRERPDGTDGRLGRGGPVGGDGAQSPDKTIERIELATHRDGVIDRWEYFDHGMLARIEQDTDGDGKIDKWETYNGGVLTTMAIDTQHRGRPDRRLVYRPNGTLDRIESDPTGTGVFQPLPTQPDK